MVAGGRDDSSYLDTVEMLKINPNSTIFENWVFGTYAWQYLTCHTGLFWSFKTELTFVFLASNS